MPVGRRPCSVIKIVLTEGEFLPPFLSFSFVGVTLQSDTKDGDEFIRVPGDLPNKILAIWRRCKNRQRIDQEAEFGAVFCHHRRFLSHQSMSAL